MSRAQVRTLRPDGTQPRYLGALGGVQALTYSFTLPGGCDQLSCFLSCPPMLRTDALDPGRIVQALLGGNVVWDGKLDEPQPSEGGWGVTAHGSGTFGSEFVATYTGSWSGAVPDAVISDAISRGLRWTTPFIGHPTGMFLGQPPDSGSMSVADMLDQLCSLGGLTWQVKRRAGGNVPQVITLPTVANRLLVSTVPAARTLGGDLNVIKIRYNSAPDLGTGYPAIYSLTTVTDQDSVNKHGPMEAFLDLGSNGPMPATDAQTVGNYVLNRYTRASFAGPFTVSPGQLLTLGGQPQDLGVFYTGDEGPMVCRLILADQGWGGEVRPGPVTFPVGAYEYSDSDGTATVTPFQSLRSDFAGLLAMRAAQAHGRRVSVSRAPGGHDLIWWFGKYAKSWGDIHRRHQAGYHPPHHMHPPHHIHRRRHHW